MLPDFVSKYDISKMFFNLNRKGVADLDVLSRDNSGFKFLDHKVNFGPTTTSSSAH